MILPGVIAGGRRLAAPATGIEFVSASQAAPPYSGSEFSLSIPRPAGVQAGDMLVFLVFNTNHLRSLSALPSGLVAQAVDSSSSNGFRVYSKIATEAEPAAYSFGFNNADMFSGIALCYRNAEEVNAVSPVSRVASGASATAPSILATSPGALICFFANESGSAQPAVTPPSGMTLRAGIYAGGQNLQAYDLIPSPSGDTGQRTLTWASMTLPGAVAMQIG